jgi:hypothetical protein
MPGQVEAAGEPVTPRVEEGNRELRTQARRTFPLAASTSTVVSLLGRNQPSGRRTRTSRRRRGPPPSLIFPIALAVSRRCEGLGTHIAPTYPAVMRLIRAKAPPARRPCSRPRGLDAARPGKSKKASQGPTRKEVRR